METPRVPGLDSAQLLPRFRSKTYPALDRLARELADELCRAINTKALKVKSKMPYKAQYVLEGIIQILEERV